MPAPDTTPQRRHLHIVCGPTASGKTGLAIRLAQELGAEIVSFDSRQYYRELNIGVARPEPEELAAVPHHFIAEGSIHQPWTAGAFARMARQILETYFQTHAHVVLVGGTGLYLKALLEGIDRPPVPEEIRWQVQQLAQSEGLPGLLAQIRAEGPDLLEGLEVHNPVRLMRTLEWIRAGRPVAESPPLPAHWQVRKMAPDWPREVLYARINQRVDLMVERGLWAEAESLYPFRHLGPLQTVGYTGMLEALDGKHSPEAAVEKIKQHTRNYAKRQLTWFRKDSEVEWVKT